MKNKNLIFIAIGVFILLFLIYYTAPRKIVQKGLEIEIIAENLDTPWGIDFLTDGRMIFTERSGKASILDNGKVNVVANLDVSEESESGLLGIAVDPDFSRNKFIYVYYTYDNGNRISRLVLNEKLEQELILIDNIPNARFHDGGRLKFSPDGKLYATTGDATIPSSAQDINSLAGKILRMNKDGTVPADNPFGNYVFSYGHRNPQGLAWHPVTKQPYASEHGQSRNDEINIIIKGKNYGWPIEECEAKEHTGPLRCYSEFTLAPSGIAFYKNSLYVAGLRGAQLRKIVFDDDYKIIIGEEELLSGFGRIRDVVEHDGYLYIATSNRDGRGIPKSGDDKIIRIKINA